MQAPPPALGNYRVLEYAILDARVSYSGTSGLFVGNQELGPVPGLAIGQDLTDREITLLHCDEDWDVLGLGADHESVADAKARAERIYPGVSECWVDPNVTEEAALKYRDSVWRRCSFCGKSPVDVNQMIHRNDVRICDSCIVEFERLLHEDSPSEE